MADVAIGYNIKQAKDLMENVKEKYNSLKSSIEDNWGNVQTTLHTEWIGEDEESYEEVLVQRIKELYKNSAELATGCCKTVAELCNEWNKFQAHNILSDAQEGRVTEIEAITFSGEVNIKAQDEGLSDSTDRGLKDEKSASTIQSSVSEFVGEIKDKATSLFEEISSNSAFFGDQVSVIDKFIQACGKAIGEVVTAVQDLHDRLAELAGSQYTNTQTNFTESLNTAETTVTNSVDDLGETRWTGK